MGNIVVTEFISLDGIVEDPGGAEAGAPADWTAFDRGVEGDQLKMAELEAADVQLLGRVTYEGYAAAWPSIADEAGFGEKMNGMPKYVVSSTLREAEWNNSTILSGDVAEEVAKLKREVDGTILVAGSAQLVQAMVEHDLVDELRLMVFPVLLGSGKRLFDEVSEKKPLRLVGSQTLGDGIALLTYEPTG